MSRRPPARPPQYLLLFAVCICDRFITVAPLQPGDNFAVPAFAGGCGGTAEFLGCFQDNQWSPTEYGPAGKAMPKGDVPHRAVPYALPGCYNCFGDGLPAAGSTNHGEPRLGNAAIPHCHYRHPQRFAIAAE